MSIQTRSVIELREVSISKSNQRDQSRTAWSLYLEKQTSVSLLQRHRQCNDLLIALSISESIRLSVHVQLVSLLQWHLFSMRWSTRSHRSTYQWIDSPISSRATSESASMTSILNAMIYSLSSLYPSVNLIIRSRATSEPATMTSPKSISSMSKSISESASMTRSIVSLLERHSKWVCYKDRQQLISWLSRSTNETSSTM